MRPRIGLALLGLSLGTLLVTWVVAMPPSSGPDEPNHLVRSAALVRGMLDGEAIEGDPVLRGFELPARVGFPDPGCFAFQPQTPASCIRGLTPPPGDYLLVTRAADYPVWGHLLPGVGTLLPGTWSVWGARLLDALVPLLTIAGALVVSARRSWTSVAGVLLAVTPLAWFIVAVVNPSGLVVGGGVGLWVGLVSMAPGRAVPGRLGPLLAAVGWTAMVLPRRDGIVYASLGLALAIVVLGIDLRAVGRRLGVGGLLLVAASTAATLVWAATSDTNASQALLVTPFVPAVAVVGRRVWRRVPVGPLRPVVAAAGVGVVVLAVSAVLSSRSPAGFTSEALRSIVDRTGGDLVEAFGELGWLDTPVPSVALFAWLVALGVLAAPALFVDDRRPIVGAGLVTIVVIVTGWILTMVQQSADGTYWQGRYYLPLLVAVPILLGAGRRVDVASDRRIGALVASTALGVCTLAFAAAIRRFGVGVSGSYSPLDWDTYGAPVHPAILLAFHAAAAVGAVVALDSLVRSTASGLAVDPVYPDGDVGTPGVGPWSGPHPTPTVERGVNVVGYHHVASGLGQIAREIHASLLEAGVPCTAVDVTATDSPTRDGSAGGSADGRPDGSGGSGSSPVYDTTVAVVPALQLPTAMHDLPEISRAHRRLVGYLFWELADVPATHRLALDLVDEVWTPTRFVHDAYSSADGAPPVRLQPTRIAEPTVEPAAVSRWRDTLLDRSDDVLVLVSFDLFSVIERKNPAGAVSAFRQAFADVGDGVRLVVKTINGDQRPDDLRTIRDLAGDDARITVLDRYVDDADLHALVAAADVFVSLHRGEGLGLHLAAAMWLGTPVVATDWSGNVDFMDETCAAMVPVTLVPVSDGRGAYPDGSMWAEPDAEVAARLLRRLATDPDERRRLAQAARRRMLDQPSRREVGEAMWSALTAPGPVSTASSPADPTGTGTVSP